MLYELFETQKTLLEPVAEFAHAQSKLLNAWTLHTSSHPIARMTHTIPFAKQVSERITAGYDLFYRLGKDYGKPTFGILATRVGDVEVAIAEQIEMDLAFCQLRYFSRLSDRIHILKTMETQSALLIVAPLSGHYATLLRDTVRSCVADHMVYITDWKNARDVPLSEGEFHLDDYVNYVQSFIRHLQTRHKSVHIMSVCQPTVPVLAALSLMASRKEKLPSTMIMMGGPIDARRSPTAVNNLAAQRPHEWFNNNVIFTVPSKFAGSGRRVYPGFLQHMGFVAMNPNRHVQSHYDYFQDLVKGDLSSAEAHRNFYDEYNAVLDMDAHYYLETIKTVFQDFSLVKGTWRVKNPQGKLELVKPADIEGVALLSVEGELDDISGSGQTRAAHDLCTGLHAKEKMHLEVPGAGHYGIFGGRRWREQVYPKIKATIAAHG